ncbi:MAG: GAF domain-containing protein [Aggregatilineales bacterium]
MFTKNATNQQDTFTRLKFRIMQALLIAITLPLLIALIIPIVEERNLNSLVSGQVPILLTVFMLMFFVLRRYPATVHVVTNFVTLFLAIFGIVGIPDPSLGLIAWSLALMVVASFFAPLIILVPVDILIGIKLLTMLNYTQDATSSAVTVGVLVILHLSISLLLRYFVNVFRKSIDVTEHRVTELEVVSQVSAEASTEMDVEKLLVNVSNLTKDRFNLYHAHIYLLNETGDTLVLSAGAGEAGQTMVAENRTITMNTERSLVARAARERVGVIVNDVTADPNFLPHPSLPDTKSEMAIPMIVGDTLVGVLDIQSDVIDRFTEEDVRIMTTLSAQVAVAVQNARAFEAIKIAQKAAGDLRDAINESAIVAITDVSGKITFVNDKFCEISKWSRKELIGQDHRIINSGAHSKEFIKAVWTTIANGKVWKGEFENRAKDGSTYWVDTTIVPFLNESGKPYQYIAIRYDITNRKLQELEIQKRANEMEVVAEVSAEASTVMDVEKLLVDVSNLTKDRFNLYHAHIYLLNETGDTLVLRAGAGEAGQTMVAEHRIIPMDAERSLVARAAREGAGVVVNDVTADPNFLPHPSLPDTKSEMAIPMIVNNEVIGVLDVQGDVTDRFTDEDVRVMTTLSAQVAVAVQNARAFENVTRARNEVERIFNTSLDMLGSANFEGYFTSLNAAWEATLGWKQEELKAEPFVSFVHPDDVQLTLNESAKLAEGAKTISFENRYRASDGSYKWVSWNAAPDMENGLIHFVARDVTEQKQAADDQQLLLRISNVLNQANTLDDLLNAIVIPASLTAATNASLLLLELDENNHPEWATIVANWLGEGSSAQLIPIGSRFYLPEFPFSELWFNSPNQPLLIGDIQNDERMDETTREVYRASGGYASVLLPLFNAGKWLGLATISWGTPQKFEHHDEYLYASITQQAIITLDAITSNEEIRVARQQAEILANANSALAGSRNEQEILAAVNEMVLPYGASFATLTYIDQDEAGKVTEGEIMAARNSNGEEFPVSNFQMTRFMREQYPILDMIEGITSGLIIVEDIENDPRIDETLNAFLEGSGVQASIMLPLHSGNQWQGLLSFVWSEKTTFSPELIGLLQAVIPNASSIVASRRAYLDAREQRNISTRRARELETVAQVSTATTTILNVEELLQAVADLTRERFDLYHAHIYLLDSDTNQLVLAAGSGEAGRIMKENNHSIDMANEYSLVALTAQRGSGIIVNDVSADASFLPNPLLPDTKSEMVIPMKLGNRIIGVLDVQGDVINRFTDDDLRIKTTLADQIAVAVQNALLFAESEQQAERERETSERLREVDRLKSQFLANMSHELRTPLNSIIGYSEVLLDGVDGELTEDAEEDVEAIHNSGKHLLSIINEILDLAKIEAGEMHLDIKDVDVVEFVSEIVRNGQVLVKNKSVELLVVQDDEMPVVSVDAVRLRQIIWNLVSNAVKFTEEGDVKVRLTRDSDKFIRISVEDSGVGMTQDGLEVIFERFSQVDGSSTRRAGGTGLGLTITKQLVEMHGGEINVTSNLGEGSIFSITLPVKVTENA